MFGHQNVTGNDESVTLRDAFQCFLEDDITAALSKQRFSLVATEGDEVKDTTVLEADESFGDSERILQLG